MELAPDEPGEASGIVPCGIEGREERFFGYSKAIVIQHGRRRHDGSGYPRSIGRG